MGRGTSGQLENVAKRRAAAQKTRKTLNIGQNEGAPQAPVRQNQPPSQVPAAEPAADQATMQDRMTAMTEQFFQEVQRPGAVPVQQPAARVTSPRPTEGMVSDRNAELGGEGRSTQQQFYRLSGRMPTPRDVAVFRVALMLEQQLGRKPTRTELSVALSRPTLLGPSAPAAVEA